MMKLRSTLHVQVVAMTDSYRLVKKAFSKAVWQEAPSNKVSPQLNPRSLVPFVDQAKHHKWRSTRVSFPTCGTCRVLLGFVRLCIICKVFAVLSLLYITV